MTKYRPEAADKLKNSRIFKPIRSRWVLVIVSAAVILTGVICGFVAADIRIFYKWLVMFLVVAFVLPLGIGTMNFLSSRLLSRKRQKKK